MSSSATQNYFWNPLLEDFTEENGWLINILPTKVRPDGSDTDFAALILFFLRSDGTSFRVTKIFNPYFYVMLPFDGLTELHDNKKVRKINFVKKHDIGTKEDIREAAQIVFANVQDLMTVRKELRNKKAELREFDVIYYERFCIDSGIRVGNWYDIKNVDGEIELTLEAADEEHARPPPSPRILAFDIECAKAPLQFPNSATDEIMMISYMVDGIGYLVINKKWFSADIDSFEYSPLKEYYCEFNVTNYPNEREMLIGWFDHIRKVKPNVFVTFNGDNFDWPYVDQRAKINNLDMFQEIGFYENKNDVEPIYTSYYAPHLDCFHWVQRDSYLPAGSRGLKAVTKAKLSYNPLELDPEDICPLGMEEPQRLANYSVSDAYATYYLYMKYIHPFIFSLCTVIPLNPDDCLRKGTGTLCESLLMARAFHGTIFFPNKSTANEMMTYKGHFLLSETYSGGRVEALESGIFRDDIPTEFNVNPEGYQDVINRVPRIWNFVCNTELKIKQEDIANYEEVNHNIIAALEDLRDHPHRNAPPIIIHLDVAAMYPNIMLTNRLQPTAIVEESFCDQCKLKDEHCQRRMKWIWRGEYYPSTEAENNAIMRQLETETFEGESWYKLSTSDQVKHYKSRLNEYCKKHYQKPKITKEEERESIICMKSNKFYIETVRSFRDRRYVYKGRVKQWNKNLAAAKTPAEKEHCKKMVILNDSMQLAHKAILNTFYGYVMRGGARWRSMEMAGVVTHTGATIIKQTRAMVQGLGRPLELDTDGIWTAIPPTFPMIQTLVLKDGSKKTFSFPCSLLNENVDHGFANHQYHQQNEKKSEDEPDSWVVRKENSIFFEVDGPYHAMFLPAAKEEGKKLKKRYAVFNSHGHITELKGFEIKRRGEWTMIKMLQKDVFDSYMYGSTRQEVYDHVADVCRQYISVLTTHGKSIDDNELLMLLSESSTMSKQLDEYGGRKSAAATTARRLVDVIGESILQSKSLKCEYIISKLPSDASVALRSIPVIVFKDSVDNIISCLQKWCGDSNIKSPDFREIVDWDYYIQRLFGTIQKILVIPSLLQGIKLQNFNVPPPDWVIKKQKEELMKKGQTIIQFSSAPIAHERAPKPIFKRDESKLTPYQMALLNAKRNWRKARSDLTTLVQTSRTFPEWRVIEIRQSSIPGVVLVYVQTAQRTVKKLEVAVSRIFYINSTPEAANFFKETLKGKVKQVKKILPHGFVADTITQFTLTEREFLDHKAEFTSSFNTSGIHGVYETQVTPLFRALCGIKTSIASIKKEKLTLADLKETKRVLLPELLTLNRIYIYSCYHGKKGLIGLVNIPAGAETAEANIFVFAQSRNEIRAPSLSNIQQAALSELDDTAGVVQLSAYRINQYQRIHEAAAALQTTLTKIGRQENSVVILQSHLNFDQLVGALKVTALHDLPVITLDYKHSDDGFDDESGRWHDYAFRNFTHRFIQMNLNIQSKLDYSIMLNTPVGNIGNDFCMDALDLLFARELSRQNHVMWYSESADPDIGGAYANQLISMPGNPYELLQVNNTGTFLTKCNDIRVLHLGVSAIIGCQALFDKYLPSHSAPAASDFTQSPTTDAISVSKGTFGVLSAFTLDLITRCGETSSILSEMIAQLGTWLSTSSSVFYDPAIHATYCQFLSTVFNELIKVIEKQNIPVVYADQGRIIINNGEFPLNTVNEEIEGNALISRLQLTTAATYDKLVWIDAYNWQGISDDHSFYEWNIANFLPNDLSGVLVDFFSEMLRTNIYKFFNSRAFEILFKVASINIDKYQINEVQENPLRNPKDVTKSNLLTLINTIFEAIKNLNDDSIGVDVEENEQNTKLSSKIIVVRRNILTDIKISEYEERAHFVDPSLHLFVPSILCKCCMNVSNIDILRDANFVQGMWICPLCKQPYDTGLIERAIFEDVCRKLEQYQTQDLVCCSCKRVQARKLAITCTDDSGKLDVSQKKEEIIDYLNTVETAARQHELIELGITVSSLRELYK